MGQCLGKARRSYAAGKVSGLELSSRVKEVCSFWLLHELKKLFLPYCFLFCLIVLQMCGRCGLWWRVGCCELSRSANYLLTLCHYVLACTAELYQENSGSSTVPEECFYLAVMLDCLACSCPFLTAINCAGLWHSGTEQGHIGQNFGK